jgi:ferredoxin
LKPCDGPVVAARPTRRARDQEFGMSAGPVAVALRQVVLERADLDRLIAVLRDDGYDVIGPVARDGAIVYESIQRAADLPVGWLDDQSPGRYRLARDGERVFGYTVGVTSWKRFLHPPRVRLWSARADGRSLEVTQGPEPARRLAFLGVRPCELAAIVIQDRVFLEGPVVDPVYRDRRANALVVAVQCSRAGRTCFCASMGTGPQATSGYDLALTEVIEDDRHYFLVESDTERGHALLVRLAARPARAAEAAAAAQVTERASLQMGRRLQTDRLPELLRGQPEHRRWNEVAKRCLACGNCTQVCPTCFCTSVVDVAALGGGAGERIRRWDSCFNPEFSYIHGGSVRPSIRARYRQWLTHKLGNWHEQFGTSGCVGCGRCIAWCPAGIDLTEEAAAIRAGARTEEPRHADA